MDNKIYTAIGLMSGTSLDGVDCALIETDGLDYVAPRAFLSTPYEAAERETIRAAFGRTDREDPAVLAAERIVTDRHVAAVRALMEREGVSPSQVDLVGFHGQTIYHAPKDGVTIQIGDSADLAKRTGIDVVGDFRVADVETGGEGAPLAPLYHAARVRGSGAPLPCVVLNIGGVANVTWIGEGGDDILAFDTGPGNALMDDWVNARTGAPYDKDGALAAAGRADEALLEQWAAHPYFERMPPKSLDRDQWDIAALGPLARDAGGLSDADGAATLLQFTARMIAGSARHMPKPPKAWYACGGGRHNGELMRVLGGMLGQRVGTVEDIGWDGDATEAECFAYLGVRSVLGLPLSLPTTTGAKAAKTGGMLFKRLKD